MCGFVAILSRTEGSLNVESVDAATEQLAHRGPDDRAIFVDGPLVLGFRRLAIFDLSSAAHQPMRSPDGRHVVAFNGAIYNWPELRRELESLGHAFTTQGDTEVLLASWREWGPDCLRRFNGMFAFVIWDRHERRLHGARDRFGVKPLFWSGDHESIRFASEIKALRRIAPTSGRDAVDWDTFANFAANDELDAYESTFFSGIRHVPAGTYFSVTPGGQPQWSRWWSLEDAVQSRSIATDPVEEFASLFEDAVHIRMRGDVPLGTMLSGGLDSTSIICAMARAGGSGDGGMPRAFSYISPDKSHDESDAITATISQTGASLERVVPDPLQLWQALDQHIWYHDEPVYSFSSLVSEQLARAARRAGVKIILNGQGADEILGGYPAYFRVHWSDMLRAGHFLRTIQEMRAYLRARPGHGSPYARAAVRDAMVRGLRAVPLLRTLAGRRPRQPGNDDWITPELLTRAEPFRQSSPATLWDALRHSLERADLPVYLRQEDRNAMAHGVESRLPFLDHRLVTLAFSLGPEWKLASPNGKHLLREAMRGRIPEIVRTEPRKLGFPTPVDAWMRGPLYGPMRDLLASRHFRESGIWQPDRVIQALELHRSGRASFGTRLFDVAQTCAWLKTTA